MSPISLDSENIKLLCQIIYKFLSACSQFPYLPHCRPVANILHISMSLTDTLGHFLTGCEFCVLHGTFQCVLASFCGHFSSKKKLI